jgi:hypothetical protein
MKIVEVGFRNDIPNMKKVLYQKMISVRSTWNLSLNNGIEI